MSVVTLRRYLQPSPTLRWHPWAPLVALVLALAMAFAAGCAVAYRFATEIHAAQADSQTFFHAAWRLDENAGNPRGVMQEAAEMDRVVMRYVAARKSKSISLRNLQERIALGAPVDTLPMVKRIAEYRLGELSGNAPRWLVTASYCSRPGAPLSGEDLVQRYEKAAAAYSEVLSRPITARTLAPAVPDGICEGRASAPK